MCWTSSSVLSLLSNEIYTGAVVALKSTFDTVTGKLKVKPKEEWSKVEGMHEAIVSKEVFQKAQEMITPQKVPSETRKQHYICGCCGRGLNRRNGTDLYLLMCDKEAIEVQKILPFLSDTWPLCRIGRAVIRASQSCRQSCNKSQCPACGCRSHHSCTHAPQFSRSFPAREWGSVLQRQGACGQCP